MGHDVLPLTIRLGGGQGSSAAWGLNEDRRCCGLPNIKSKRGHPPPRRKCAPPCSKVCRGSLSLTDDTKTIMGTG
ncbi:hypothetical protein USDA257_c60940 [Sinorhizobium fredii USDA 257]|uniref:Uncharacterized protein n=1 Tax=Sinorhizobium fredii (strain USDA 257) TaxID=1185652 RepID=I3XFD8_SINF2|nr:hypothetical protein USDA257_c60940 [Sinorhizobium fredii USDA 257]